MNGPFSPAFTPLIFHPDFEANRLKSLGLRADEFLHPTTFDPRVAFRYDCIFMAAGQLFGNPMIPMAMVLLWEGVKPFLPAARKEISVIHCF